MPHPTLIGIRHEILARPHEGGKCCCWSHESDSCYCQLYPPEACCHWNVQGAPRKTAPRQDCALFRMVQKDRFISARALTARIRNLYGTRAGQKTINKRLLSHCYHAYRPNRKSLLTANHHCLHLEWAQSLQNLTMAHSQHVIFGDESRLQLYLADGWCRVRSLPGERLQQ